MSYVLLDRLKNAGVPNELLDKVEEALDQAFQRGWKDGLEQGREQGKREVLENNLGDVVPKVYNGRVKGK